MKQFIPKTIATYLAIVLLGGGLFIGARKITRATQTGPPPCQQQPKPECFPRGQRPICPNPNPPPCTLDAVAPGTATPKGGFE